MGALLQLALLGLLATADAHAGAADASSAAAKAAFEAMAPHASCGACLAAGGAWCLATQPPRCVPDGRELCGAGGPEDMVGWAGHGKCPDPADWELQTYLHAPRRPPPLGLQQPAAADCAERCAATHTAPLGEPAEAAEMLERCGLVLLPRVFEPETPIACKICDR